MLIALTFFNTEGWTPYIQFCCLFSSFIMHFKDLLMTEHRFSFCFSASWHFTVLIYCYIIDLCPIEGHLFLIFCYQTILQWKTSKVQQTHLLTSGCKVSENNLNLGDFVQNDYCNKGREVITAGGILQLEDMQTSKSRAEKGYSFIRKTNKARKNWVWGSGEVSSIIKQLKFLPEVKGCFTSLWTDFLQNSMSSAKHCSLISSIHVWMASVSPNCPGWKLQCCVE